MKTISSYLSGVLLALASAFTCAATPLTPAACDSAFVTRSGNVITVRPSGINDTVNLQCAFDTAVAAGPDIEVRLVEGTYHTAQIVANGFHGRWAGAGVERTAVMNLPNLYVTPVDFYVNPPSASNPGPVLFAFVNGDIAISDLAIRIVGSEPTMGWSIFGISPPIKSLATAIVIEGTYANAHIDNILIVGEATNDPLYGYNLYNGIYFEGFIGNPSPPISGSFEVTNSTFRTIASGTPSCNISGASELISHNKYENVILGMDNCDFVNSQYEFSYNTVDALSSSLYDLNGIMQSTTLLIHNNTFRGTVGIDLEMTFGDGNQCLLLGNNVQNVSDIGIILGAATKGCTVVGGSNKTNVLDLGTGNVLVGVNNMSSGVGPTVRTLMKMMK